MVMRRKGFWGRLVELARDELTRRLLTPLPAAPAGPRAPLARPEGVEPSWEPPPPVLPTRREPGEADGVLLEASFVAPELLAVRFRGTSAHFAAARRRVGEPASLRLRVVTLRIEGVRIEREIIDVDVASPIGHAHVAVPTQQRCVVSLGVAAGDRFASVAHTTLAPADADRF